MNDCGGCRGEGAHRRWCREVVGTAASVYGPMAEELGTMGDMVGPNNFALANRLWALSSDMRDFARSLIPDVTEPVTDDTGLVWIDSIAESSMGVQVGGGVLHNVHSEEKCAGRPCVIHNPSDHHMRDWPTNWRDDRGLMERICQHGVGHPDPDALAYHESIGESWQAIHGCDFCCQEPK